MVRPIEIALISAKERGNRQDTGSVPPLGLLSIAAHAMSRDYSVRVLDLNVPAMDVDSLVEFLDYHRALKVVGISSTTISFLNGLRIAGIVKHTRPDVFVVMGGPHVSFEYEEALGSGHVDFVVRSDGEVAFVQLCDALIRSKGSLDDVPNLTFNGEDGKIKLNALDFRRQPDLDSLAPPKRSLVNLEHYSRPYHVLTSRGCPGKCVFCAAGGLCGGFLRRRSVDSVIHEIEELITKYGAKSILIADDTFTFYGRDRILAIAKYLKRKDVLWACESRVDVKDLGLFHMLVEHNCVGIQIGIESFSQEVLDTVQKRIETRQVLDVLRTCQELGVQVFGNIIVGLPGDTEESFKLTADTVLRLVDQYGLRGSCSICTPYPGTDIHRNPGKYGMRIVERNWDLYDMAHSILDTEHLSPLKQKELHYSFLTSYTARQPRWQSSLEYPRGPKLVYASGH